MKQIILKKSGIDYTEIKNSGKKFFPFLKFDRDMPKNVVFLEYLGQKIHFFGYNKDEQVLMHEFSVLDVSTQTESTFSTQSKRFLAELEKNEPILNKELWVLKTGKGFDTKYKISENREEISFMSMSLEEKMRLTGKAVDKSAEEIYDLMNLKVTELSGLIDDETAITLVRKDLGL